MLTSLRASPQLSNVLQSSSGSVGSGSQTSFLSDSPEVTDRRADETQRHLEDSGGFLCWNFVDVRTELNTTQNKRSSWVNVGLTVSVGSLTAE